MNTTPFLGVPDPAERATLTVWPEAAAILGLSKASAYAAAERGDIPTIRIGRRLLVPTAALRRMLHLDAAHPEPTASTAETSMRCCTSSPPPAVVADVPADPAGQRPAPSTRREPMLTEAMPGWSP